MDKFKVSVITRFHDIKYIKYLERAIQSLHGQTNVQVMPVIVLQGFSQDELNSVMDMLNSNWFFPEHLEPQIVNFRCDKGVDVRSHLLNEGIKEHLSSKNRFLAFLDYDDVLYSHAYDLLAQTLDCSGSAIGFATVEVANVIPFYDYDFVYEMTTPYVGENKLDLLKENFCPLHSYLLDTDKLDPSELFFREDLNRVEDYEFLLRIAGKNSCNFKNLGKKIGCYFMRSNGTNTTPDFGEPEKDSDKLKIWKDCVEKLNKYKAEVEVKFFASDF